MLYRKQKYEYAGAAFRFEGVFVLVSEEASNPTSFVLRRTEGPEKARRYKYGDRSTVGHALAAVEALSGSATKTQVEAYLLETLPNYNVMNAGADLGTLSLNSPSRGHYGPDKHPRRSDEGQEADKLFKRGKGSGAVYELYDVGKHGVWELRRAAAGETCEVREVRASMVATALLRAENVAEAQSAFSPVDLEDARSRTYGA